MVSLFFWHPNAYLLTLFNLNTLMKLTVLFLLCFVAGISLTMGQSRASTKIYFYCWPSTSLTITQAPDQPIKIGRCTLLESSVDSIGIPLTRKKNIYLHFEPGKTYYFQRTLTDDMSLDATGVLTPMTEEAFWLNAALSRMGTYRHYRLDTTGLQLLEEER